MIESDDFQKKDSVVYIAGKYLGNEPHETNENIKHAKNAMLKLTREGWMVYCPHMNSAHFEVYHDIPNSFWYRHGEEMLSRCDGIYMLEGWEDSKGAVRELELALDLGLKVFYGVEE